MNKYLLAASLFLFNNEVISWLALAIICAMALIAFAKAADAEERER